MEFYAVLDDCRNLRPTAMPDVAERDCPDCAGTGKFPMPDDTLEPCVRCKETGRVLLNLPMEAVCP